MAKASEPPKCRVCGSSHWGTCHMPDALAVAQARVKKLVSPEPGVDHREPPRRPVAKSGKSEAVSYTAPGKPPRKPVRKRAKKSTASRKDAKGGVTRAKAQDGTQQLSPAGTQAPPVETKTETSVPSRRV